MEKENKMTRRKAIGGLSVGLASLAVAPAALGQAGSSVKVAAAAMPLEDPRGKYPKPPFKNQRQPWPGLVSQMDPRPDHGEKSYKGSGRLAGRKALITGGDSGMAVQQQSHTHAKERMLRSIIIPPKSPMHRKWLP